MKAVRVGDKFWRVYRSCNSNEGHEVTITRVGRDKVSFNEKGRYGQDTTAIMDGLQIISRYKGKLYPSKDAAENQAEAVAAWFDMVDRITNRYPPETLTLDDVNAMRAKLNLPIWGSM